MSEEAWYGYVTNRKTAYGCMHWSTTGHTGPKVADNSWLVADNSSKPAMTQQGDLIKLNFPLGMSSSTCHS